MSTIRATETFDQTQKRRSSDCILKSNKNANERIDQKQKRRSSDCNLTSNKRANELTKH